MVYHVTYLEYLGYIINNNGDCVKEVRRRLAIAFQSMKKLWRDTSKETKERQLRTAYSLWQRIDVNRGP
uniref:Uncharacterized protein n=1 Tax=Arion vulgaris TaxID=1028688 RepID=A0A0B7AZD3_9EUPU